MKRQLTIIALLACVLQAIGQNHLPDMTLERDFAAQVKSINEFINRFNGDEIKPGLRAGSLRRDNILSLFDFKMSHGGLQDAEFKELIDGFSKEAASWKEKLSIDSKGTIAEAVSLVKYGGKQYHISLLLQREKTTTGNLRWGVVGVKGLASLGLYNDKRVTISPVDHETHFMSLIDLFQSNRKLVPSLRSQYKEIDELSFFLGFFTAKGADFIQVEKLVFHFTDLPHYAFVVEEIGREGTNSGWLITRLLKMSQSEKEQYINTLLNNR